MNKKILFLGAALCFSLTACNDFLDIKPKGIVIPETCDDYEALLREFGIRKYL